MSGGVDSSVAAALLKNQGYNVVGVFMQLFKTRFRQTEAQENARKVAKKLEIPFYVLNFEKEFKKEVVNYFLKEYALGRTPNPCVVCNRKIKFDLLLKRALGMGADYVATGHYVKKLAPGIANFSSRSDRRLPPTLKLRRARKSATPRECGLRLFTAKDKEKDQSYFLYTLTQEQLKYVLFPLGDYTKQEVRALADKWQLPYQERESEDLCFISEKNHNEFLKRHLELRPGNIVCGDKVIGKHEGLSLYTIGQRKEIRLGGGPYWVIGFDFKKNLLKVTDVPNDPLLYKDSLKAKNVNWISGREPKLPLKAEVKIRYGHKAVPAIISDVGVRHQRSCWCLTPQRAVTPGQSVVFYRKDELLGGGIIAD